MVLEDCSMKVFYMLFKRVIGFTDLYKGLLNGLFKGSLEGA